MANHGNGGGTGQWFNDRRFSFNGPQRLRDNVSQILNDLNNQIVQDNPELLNQLADQFQRLQEILNGRRATPRSPNANQPNVVETNHDPDGQMPSHSQQVAPRFVQAANLTSQTSRSQNGARIDDPTNSSVVLNMEFENESAQTHPASNQNNIDEEAPQGEAETSLEQEIDNVRRSPEWQRLMQAGQNPDIQKCLRFAASVLPFLLLILLKLILFHITGLVMFAILVITFFYAERAVCRQIAAKSNRSKLALIWICCVLTLVLYTFYYVFADESLHLAFIFQAPLSLHYETKSVSLATVLWITVCTDFATKYFVLIAKCLLAFTPSSFLTFRRKSIWYQWVEFTSHSYRHWLPIPIWWAYLSGSYDAGHVQYVLANILTFTYVVLKFSMFRSKFRSWYVSTRILWNPVPFGCTPKTTDLIQAGPNCSICYGDFVSPVQLVCKHIFCEECVSTWLDKERTCPVCRAQIGTEDRSYRDGSTTYGVQIC